MSEECKEKLYAHGTQLAAHEERFKSHAERLKELGDKKVDIVDYDWLKRGVWIIGGAAMTAILAAFFKIILKV